jgi:hypothetical protein
MANVISKLRVSRRVWFLLAPALIACGGQQNAGQQDAFDRDSDSDPGSDVAGNDDSNSMPDMSWEGDSNQPRPVSVTGHAIRSPNVEVVPAAAADAISVQSDRLVVGAAGRDWALSLQAAKVLVSSAGNGFMRRVLSVKDLGDTVEVMTEPAHLGYVFDDAHLRFALPGLAPTVAPVAMASPGTRSTKRQGDTEAYEPLFRVDVKDLLLFEGPSETDVKVELTQASIRFDPGMWVDYERTGFGLEKLGFQLDGDLRADFEYRVTIHEILLQGDPAKKTPFTVSKDITLAEYKVKVDVAGVPVVLIPRVKLVFGVDVLVGADPWGGPVVLTGRLAFNSAVQTWVEYNKPEFPTDEAWTSDSSGSFIPLVTGPEMTGTQVWWGKVKPFVGMKVELSVYDVAGPYFEVRSFWDWLFISINTFTAGKWADWMGVTEVEPGCNEATSRGVEAKIGIGVAAFGWDIADYDVPVFQQAVPLSWTECDCSIDPMEEAVQEAREVTRAACIEASYQILGCGQGAAYYRCYQDYYLGMASIIENSQCGMMSSAMYGGGGDEYPPSTPENARCQAACFGPIASCYSMYPSDSKECEGSCDFPIPDGQIACLCACPDLPPLYCGPYRN